METNEKAKYLVDKLNRAGCNNLATIDIYSATSMIRDPLTKEIVVPFETPQNKTDESRELAWKRAHEDAEKNKLKIDNNLKIKKKNIQRRTQQIITQHYSMENTW